jgi:CBS domain-containing protein
VETRGTRVAEVMSRGVELVPPDATVREAATFMAEHDVGAALIGEGDRPVGILTDRDVILRVVIPGADAGAVRARDAMSSHLFSCRTDDTIEGALRAMDERQVRRLPVFDGDGRLAGIVARSDIMRRLLGGSGGDGGDVPPPRPELDAPVPTDGP